MIKPRNTQIKIFVYLFILLGGGICSQFSPIVTYADTTSTVKYTPNPVDCSPDAKKAREALYVSYGFGYYDPCSTNCSSASTGTGATTVSTLSGADNRQKIWNYLIARGLSPEQTAGVMGNIQSESGGTFSPTINEFSQKFPGGGYGIVQWTGDRRGHIVDALNSANADLMAKYYNASYSSSGSYTGVAQGFVSKNKDTGDLMPVADNDALLLTELNFMVDEAMSRTLHKHAVDQHFGSSSDIEWNVIEKQKTITDASNVWLYSYEAPGTVDYTVAPTVDTVAVARAQNGQTIYNLYNGSPGSSAGAACSTGGSKQELAKKILASGNISYWVGPDGNATEKILTGIASGANNGNDWPCGMNLNILKIIDAITTANKLIVNDSNRACIDSTAGGLSSTASLHYAGNGSAIDLGRINGLAADSTAGATLFVQLAMPFLVSGSRIGQVQCFSIPNLPPGVTRFPDGCTHLHIDVPPNVDLALKCKLPNVTGVCDASQRV